MPEVQDVIVLHPETVENAENLVKERKARERRPRRPRSETPVESVRVHPLVWAKARELAGEDNRRIVVESTTSVLVRNS